MEDRQIMPARAGQRVWRASRAPPRWTSDQSVALPRIEKKKGTGWQTRIVRLQRSWWDHAVRQPAGGAQQSTGTGQSTIFRPRAWMRRPRW